jgi:DNA-binding NarL/FixJ family response regulator
MGSGQAVAVESGEYWMTRIRNRVRVLVADETESIRHRVSSILFTQSAGYLVEEAANEQELLKKILQHRPRIVIWDFAQSSLGGLDVMRKVRECWPETRMIVLSQRPEEQLVRAALDLGVCSYVLKSEFESKIALAVAAASAGLCLLDHDVVDMVAKGYLDSPTAKSDLPAAFSRLTAREFEVVRLLTLGSGNRQVALKLGIRVRTVESHRANIMRKLNVHTLTELIHLAVRQGIIHIPTIHVAVAQEDSASR